MGKKGRPHKEKLVENIRTSCDEYSHIYVFAVENNRNSAFKDIRLHWESSRSALFVFGAIGSSTVAEIGFTKANSRL